MKHAVSVAHIVQGEVVSVKVLSRTRERREVLAALAVVGATVGGAAALMVAAASLSNRVLYGPGFVLAWLAVAALFGVAAGRRALGRAGRYALGSAIDDDAFAPSDVDLVRRERGGYQLGLVRGMSGRIEGRRVPVPVEALVAEGRQAVPLAPGMRAEVALGTSLFVVTCPEPSTSAAEDSLPSSAWPFGRFSRFGGRAVLVGAIASLLCATRAGATITEADMRSPIPKNATPWEIEKMLRYEAQIQASSLHRCFDPMPIECQRPGYVGVGLSLSREGEIRSRWIARSTYGQDCPVEQCMADVIGGWFFEALPEAITVVLPVQVLRTNKPLPPKEVVSSCGALDDAAWLAPPMAERRAEEAPRLP